MNHERTLVRLLLLAAVFSLTRMATAQSVPTATQEFRFSAFAGGTGVLTDLMDGKNLDITAGVDFTYLGFRHFKPAAEIRGSYPIDSGHINSQKSFLAGPKIEYPLGRLHPYADFFVGRGEIDYNPGTFVVGGIEYLSSNTFVYSPGGGVDYDLTHHIGIKADAQYEHWNTPVVPSGSIHPTAVTLGVVYTFDFNKGRGYF